MHSKENYDEYYLEILSETQKTTSHHNNLNQLEVSFLSGCVAGIANVLSGHPLDTVKVRMQMTGKPLLDSFKSIITKEGPLALYKGIRSPLYNVPLIYAFYFGSFELGKCIQGIGLNDNITWYQSMVAGGFSGLLSTIVLTPIELVKCKLQMEGEGKKIKTSTGLTMTKSIVKVEGVKGLYRGGVITVLREVPGNAVYFGLYDVILHHFTENYGHSTGGVLCAGAAAGFFSWVMVYPQDILKTKLQCDVGNGVRKYPSHKLWIDGGIINCAKEIYKADGLRGFTKGISACSVKGIVAEASTFLVYEKVKRYITRQQEISF